VSDAGGEFEVDVQELLEEVFFGGEAVGGVAACNGLRGFVAQATRLSRVGKVSRQTVNNWCAFCALPIEH
jgi:hypothetical protein